MKSKTSRVYLDNAATTRIDPLVLEEMSHFERQSWGVATQVHSIGREARRAFNASRERIARCLGGPGAGVREEEIVFTSGATEANNLALLGVARTLSHRGNHIITSCVEHPSVLLTCKSLEKQGFKVTYLPVDTEGLIDPDDVGRAIKDETILISILLAEGETGAVQPVGDIANIAKSREVAFHTDAAQAIGKISVHPAGLGTDLLSISAHKFHGPKGVGALYVRLGTRVSPLLHGGSEQATLRPGTMSIVNCVGMAKALELATDGPQNDTPRVASLREHLLRGVLSLASKSDVRLNGPKNDNDRLPGNLSLQFEGLEAESLLLNLDMAGICVGAGAPCASGALEPSYVLLAMGLSSSEALRSIRLSLARDNTPAEVDFFLGKLKTIVYQLRSVSV